MVWNIDCRFYIMISSTCLKLGAPSWIGSLGSSLWIFSKWSYLSTQTFMGLFCSLLLASSFTFFWYLSLLIHSHLGQSTLQQVILTIWHYPSFSSSIMMASLAVAAIASLMWISLKWFITGEWYVDSNITGNYVYCLRTDLILWRLLSISVMSVT